MGKMFTRLTFIAIAFIVQAIVPAYTFAQSFLRKENNVWMNNGEGLDFNSGSPQHLPSSWQSPHLGKSSASICDAHGNLLFYTDGNIVWNKHNDVMPGGWDINNNANLASNTYFIEPVFGISSFTFDGVVIMPMPGSSHKYYIFSSPLLWTVNSIGLYSGIWQGKLYCTVVDMELNNNLGGIVAGQRGRIIAEGMAGNLHAVTGEDCNYWLVGFGSGGDYKAFNITAAGIDTIPVLSTLTPPLSPTVSELNLSPNRLRSGMALTDEVQICDFDPATGQFSNDISIGAQNCKYLSFSPNSSLAYFSGVIGLRQYNLASLATPFTLLTFNNITAFEYDAPLRLASNGKIYLSYSHSLPVTGTESVAAHIQQPNTFGIGCQMALIQNQSLPLLENDWVIDYSFPNEIPVVVYDTLSSIKEAPLCFNQPMLLTPESGPGTDYHWMVNTSGYTFQRKGSDTSSTLLATVPGKYAVQYFTSNPCVLHRDTFYVNSVSFSLYLGADKVSCDGTPIDLKVNVPGADFLWPDNSTANTYRVDATGIYWVAATREGCTATDSVKVTIVDIHQDLGEDTTLCLEDEGLHITLAASAAAGSTVLWNTGNTEPSIQVADSGLYWVTVTNQSCIGSDSIFIHKEYCDCPVLFPNAFSPNNDGNNDIYKPAIPSSCPIRDYKLQIYNQWGQMIFVSYKPEIGWDGNYNGRAADVGTYMYQLQMTTGLRKTKMVKHGDFTLLR
jgi:gliding motility-associated-like protein